MTDTNYTVTGLLTLLNVSALKSNKRKFPDSLPAPNSRLNKRRVAVRTADDINPASIVEPTQASSETLGHSIDTENPGHISKDSGDVLQGKILPS